MRYLSSCLHKLRGKKTETVCFNFVGKYRNSTSQEDDTVDEDGQEYREAPDQKFWRLFQNSPIIKQHKVKKKKGIIHTAAWWIWSSKYLQLSKRPHFPLMFAKNFWKLNNWSTSQNYKMKQQCWWWLQTSPMKLFLHLTGFSVNTSVSHYVKPNIKQSLSCSCSVTHNKNVALGQNLPMAFTESSKRNSPNPCHNAMKKGEDWAVSTNFA